jgi:potassium channel subfamily K, other eukaryote
MNSVYALIAVPIMTSFAVQTVISTMSYFANQRVTLRGKKMDSRPDPEVNKESEFHREFPSHGQLVLDAHSKFKNDVDMSSLLRREWSYDSQDEVDKDIRRVLSLATKLEGHSRRLLVGHLCASDNSDICLAGNLLKADWNVQRREILYVLGDNIDSGLDLDGDGKPDFEPGAKSDIQRGVHTALETLEEVKKYRVVFAEFLAAAAALQRLEGRRRLIYERRKAYNTSAEFIDKQLL